MTRHCIMKDTRRDNTPGRRQGGGDRVVVRKGRKREARGGRLKARGAVGKGKERETRQGRKEVILKRGKAVERRDSKESR